MLEGGVDCHLDLVDIDILADKTENFSPADLKTICQDAAMGPLRELDFETLLKTETEDVSIFV